MTTKEIITDRIMLMSDIIQYAPKVDIFECLTDEQAEELLKLLNVLTDKAEEVFTGMPHEEEMPEGGPMGYGMHQVIENGIICGDCDLHCEIHWDENANITGARCNCGITAARSSREQLGLGGEKK